MKRFAFILLIIIFLIYISESQQKWAEPTNLTKLNSSYNEFAPSWNIFENILYFNSDKSSYSKFYTSQMTNLGIFSEPVLVPGSINQSGNNQSYIFFQTEERSIISTYRQGILRPYINLFYSEKKKKSWSQAIKLDSLEMDGFAAQACLSNDGSFMIFVTDYKNEHRDTDLWMALLKDNGTWGSLTPINELNTNGNEITPFLASGDTLYFSSDGQEGPGGLDIYYSVRKEGIWSKPFPVQELNTPFNESDFIILPGGESIFSSDRPGGAGQLDLYISSKEEIKSKPDNIEVELDISLAAQVSIIRTNSDLTYKLLPVIPVYPIDKVNNHYLLPNEFQMASIEPNLDSIMSFSLPIIAKRAKEIPESRININLFYSEESAILSLKNTAVKIKKFFYADWGLDSSRFTISEPQKTNENSAYLKNYIKFSSDSAALFEPLAIGKFGIALDPPVLDLNLNARPSLFIRKWDCNLFVNNRFIKTSSQGLSVPAEFSIDFNPLTNELADADSVKMTCSLQDTTGRMHYKSMSLNISHSLNKSKEFTKIGNTLCDIYYLYYAENELNASDKSYQMLISSIGESSSFSGKVIVNYYSSNAESSAKKLASVISQIINDNRIPVETKLEPWIEELPFSRELSLNVLRIIIEKQIVN